MAAPGRIIIQRLEPRTLLSAWSTVQDIPDNSVPTAMTADSAGNVYVIGYTSNWVGMIREKDAGGSVWKQTLIPQLGRDTHCVAVDAKGDVFVAGEGAGGIYTPPEWTVVERPAGATGFSVVDAVDASSPGTFTFCLGIATDSSGNIYAVGTSISQTLNHWIVRKLSSGQGKFTTVDDYQYHVATGARSTLAEGVTVIPSGSSAGLYVVGRAKDANYFRWLVRKSADGGKTWSLVDNFQYAATGDSMATVVIGDGHGDVYVGGSGAGPSNRWIIRKSANGGATWSTSDNYQLALVGASQPEGIAMDLAGNLFVVGGADDNMLDYHSVVRTNAGGTWTTIDDYRFSTQDSSYPGGIAIDASGNLYVALQGNDYTLTSHFIIRTSAGNLTASAVSFKQTEGQTYSGTLATFTDPQFANASQFTATIKWGDGSAATSGIIAKSGAAWKVAGNHVYKQAGTYHLTVTVKDSSANSATVNPTATISDAPLHVTARTFTVGQSTLSLVPQLLATFADPNTYSTAGNFTASISWGDGTTATGAVKWDPIARVYDVLGLHKYAAKKKYAPIIVITDTKGSKATAQDSVTIN